MAKGKRDGCLQPFEDPLGEEGIDFFFKRAKIRAIGGLHLLTDGRKYFIIVSCSESD